MPAPPAERLKIRCYRCNQLLAVMPGKAGTVVACPKCKADLLIPRPEPEQPADEPADPSVFGLKSGTFPALSPVPDPATATGRAGARPRRRSSTRLPRSFRRSWRPCGRRTCASRPSSSAN